MKRKYDPQKHKRRSVRLKEYDYSQVGAYFITICAYNRESLFGEVLDGKVELNEFGKTVRDVWNSTGEVRKNVRIDEYIVMPNHMHGILVIVGVGTTRRIAPTNEEPIGLIAGSIGVIIGQFKSIVTKRINAVRGTSGLHIWQRNYYEHIIRNEDELSRIREYIIDNPLYWQFDRENLRKIQDNSYNKKWRDFEERIYGKEK